MREGKPPPIRRNFQIGIIESVPWSYMNEGSSWEGLCIELIKKLSECMNFDYTLVTSFDDDIITIHDETSRETSGVIADLINQKTDMVIAPIPMAVGKEDVLEYITPYFDNSGISIVVRKPMRKDSFFKFMTVLSFDVWISIILAVFITAIVYWLIEKFYHGNKGEGANKQSSLRESIWFALITFISQGTGSVPSNLPHRVLMASYWIFVLIVMTTFTANMAAFLTVERLQTPITSLGGLFKQTRVAYTVVNNSHAHQYFSTMRDVEDILFDIWKDLILNQTAENESKYRTWDYPIREEYRYALKVIERNKPVPDISFGLQRVLDNEKGELALIHDAAAIKYYSYRDCRLSEIGHVFGERPYSVIVTKNSTLKDELTIKILDLHESRYFESMNAKYWSNISSCTDDEENQSVALESLGGVFISSFCGIIVALTILIIEIIIAVHKRKKENTKFKVITIQNTVYYIPIFNK